MKEGFNIVLDTTFFLILTNFAEDYKYKLKQINIIGCGMFYPNPKN
jgi:hypothetical protein